MTQEFTHLDSSGNAHMVDVGAKSVTARAALAEGCIGMPATLIEKLEKLAKGNAYQVARLAGIMAAKQTGSLIPLCHPLPLDSVEIQFEPRPAQGEVRVIAQAKCHGRTGVEMEAMTAASVALLTLYDMAKSVEKGLVIKHIRLLKKTGGKSGTWEAAP